MKKLIGLVLAGILLIGVSTVVFAGSDTINWPSKEMYGNPTCVDMQAGLATPGVCFRKTWEVTVKCFENALPKAGYTIRINNSKYMVATTNAAGEIYIKDIPANTTITIAASKYSNPQRVYLPGFAPQSKTIHLGPEKVGSMHKYVQFDFGQTTPRYDLKTRVGRLSK